MSGATRDLPNPAWGTNGSPMPTVKFSRGNCKMSCTVRKVAGNGIGEAGGCVSLKIPDNLRREQKHRDGLVVEVGASSSRGLPITTKTYVMHALLPADNIIQVITPPQDGSCGGNSNREV